jgi:hypothetical protein
MNELSFGGTEKFGLARIFFFAPAAADPPDARQSFEEQRQEESPFFAIG